MSSRKKFGPFEIEQKLGSGGMGVVYLATYTKNGQKVALKVLTPALSGDFKLLKRFEREIEILKKLKHPNIVQYYGGGKIGDQRFYAMEYVSGGSLEDLIKQKGRLGWEQVIELGKQICDGLEFAHSQGVIHRDLKPANLFLTDSRKLKLGDFGIARDTQATALTAAGKTVGTYAYMAPEQITGTPEVGPKTDLYALGCVLFEMLTGKPPFQAESQPELLFQHVDSVPPRVTATALDCPIWLENIVQQCLEKDSADRPYDALAVNTALGDVGQKVAQQSSVTKQTVAGGATAVTVDTNDPEIRKILGKKKKKKKKQVPIYETGWFLAVCLLLLIGGITWAVWPLNEEQLYARAQPLMETDDPDQWRIAREKYLEPLTERFPESAYAEQVQAWIARIDEEKAMRQLNTAARLNREPRSASERLMIEALRSEQAGDRLLALHRFRNVINLLQASNVPEDRSYISISKRKIVELQQVDAGEGDEQLVNVALRRADDRARHGALREADELFTAVIDLYGDKLEFREQVEYARKRRDREDIPLMQFGDDPSAPQANGDVPQE